LKFQIVLNLFIGKTNIEKISFDVFRRCKSLLNNTFDNKNLYEIKYIDINDRNHEEKTAFSYGFNEEEISEEFIEANLECEEFNVINEPSVIINSIKLIDKKYLV
jgi:hypothetical protein